MTGSMPQVRGRSAVKQAGTGACSNQTDSIMTLAIHTDAANPGTPAASEAGAAPGLSLMLVNGALQCIALARECIEGGRDPRAHLRSAVLRVRELPATLPMASNDPMAVSFGELCEYICRQLATVGSEEGLLSLEDTSDLLREICRAWVNSRPATATRSAEVTLAAEL